MRWERPCARLWHQSLHVLVPSYLPSISQRCGPDASPRRKAGSARHCCGVMPQPSPGLSPRGPAPRPPAPYRGRAICRLPFGASGCFVMAMEMIAGSANLQCVATMDPARRGYRSLESASLHRGCRTPQAAHVRYPHCGAASAKLQKSDSSRPRGSVGSGMRPCNGLLGYRSA